MNPLISRVRPEPWSAWSRARVVWFAGLVGAVVASVFASGAMGQPGGAPPANPFEQPTPTESPFGQPAGEPAATPEPAQPSLDDLVPQVRAGFRSEFLRQKQQVIPVVVVVPDAGSYVRAVAAWTPLTRFPVLIDDGSRLAREDIARFVRGFKPERVVRWEAPNGPPVETAEQKRAVVEEVLRGVWGYGTTETPTLPAAVRAACGSEAPGVVVAGPSDPAWTAGLALAVGRGQPLVWVEARQDVSDAFTNAEGAEFCAAVEREIAGLGIPWSVLGDLVDTVALCVNTPVRITTAKAGEWIATTDRLGHVSDLPNDPNRWGWSSQIHGSEAQAAYRAMCALFLQLSTGWFFDGYPAGQPWDTYALRFARDGLSGETGPRIELIERPANGLAEWRAALTSAIDAALVMVNTKGMRNFFELPNGTGWCGDIPMLEQPAAVSFIHSWSAYQPGDRNCLSGRWFERGAFAYCGAVQEPYLSAFQKPVGLAARLAALVPWSIACRLDGTPAWRIAVFGDPLLTLGVAQDRSPDPLPLEGAEALDELMRTALRAGDLDRTVESLVLLGRDGDVARLIARLRAEDPERITPVMAEASLGALFREGAHEDLRGVYRLLDAGAAAAPANRDILWLSCRADLPDDGSVMAVLQPHIRPEQATSDTADLALMAFSCGQRQAAITLLTEYRRTLTDVAQQRLIDRAMSMVRGL